MDDTEVLSTEEVDAILKATQDQGNADNPLTAYSTHLESATQVSLKNINEVIRLECEKSLSLLLRKKLSVEIKKYRIENLASLSTQIASQSVFAIYSIQPNNYYGLMALNLSFIHQVINILFGGQLLPDESVIEKPGKIGVIVSEKIAKECIPACAAAFAEYVKINCEVIKATSTPIFSPYLTMHARMYVIDFSVYFDTIETKLYLAVPEEALQVYLPNEAFAYSLPAEDDNWKSVIGEQLLESSVWLTANLMEKQIALKDFLQLKKDDLIEINDPTDVTLMLNDMRLFKATAGQSNDKRVVKITEKLT